MIVLHGVEKFVAGIERKQDQMRAATRAATAKALHLIERRAKEMLSTYSHEAGTPTPSGPGDPPALITGNLRRSITVKGPEDVGLGRWRGQVGPTAVYGRIQELGGSTGRGVLPARPYMQPAFDQSIEEIKALFRAAWTDAIIK